MPAIAADGIQRCHALLMEAQLLLEESGQQDIAVQLYHPLGALEERFVLPSTEDANAVSASKKALS